MIDEIVERYIKMRDKKAEYKAEYTAKVADIDAAMARIENHLLARMQEQGLKSMPTVAGTAYIQHRTSASVAEWNSFLQFVRENDMWNLLEHRASLAALTEYKAANDDLPPGVNWNESLVVNVKRS